MENPKSFIGRSLSCLPSPALVVSLPRMKKNCLRVLDNCTKAGIFLRPHVKTHKTLEGALLQTGGRKSGIVVSTVAEAAFYVGHGFDDIVVGRPVTKHLLDRCSQLIVQRKLHFLVNSSEGLDAVCTAGTQKNPISTLLKVSAGYQRAGIDWDNKDTIVAFAKRLVADPNTHFEGVYAHCGNSYTSEIGGAALVRDETVDRLLQVKKNLLDAGIECPNIGLGSTPSASLPVTNDLKLLTEIHAGNYAFYDCQQESYGACKREGIAARVMTRVVSHHPNRNQILVDLGFTGLTRQGLDLAVPGFGAIDGHPNLKLSAMTQELGKIETVDGSPFDFSKYPIDSVLFIFPYHSCASAGTHQHYYIHNDDDTVADVWFPVRGW